MANISLKFLLAFVGASIAAQIAYATPATNSERGLVEMERRITHVGRGTWFHPGLGNCGIVNNDNDPILAIGKALYDRNNGGNCGQKVVIANAANGNTVTGTVEDSCQSCGDNDIDMSPSLFEQLAPLDVGVIQVSWNFLPK